MPICDCHLKRKSRLSRIPQEMFYSIDHSNGPPSKTLVIKASCGPIPNAEQDILLNGGPRV